MIVFTMFLLLWFGGEFGVSANLRTMCAIGGAGKHSKFFDFDWKGQIWNLMFILGAVIGGFIAVHYLGSPDPVQVSEATQTYFKSVGIMPPQPGSGEAGYVPNEIFGPSHLGNWKNLLLLILGGFLVGFGTRYAGGCTSGHAISGLSNLQLPSLIAVVGFFIGGLAMTWFILPFILNL
jgi:uncharacterized membrane protein YedE/YeeE